MAGAGAGAATWAAAGTISVVGATTAGASAGGADAAAATSFGTSVLTSDYV